LRGRGEHRGRRGGGGLDAKCHALAPTARGISLACGRLVVGTGPRSDGGPHTHQSAREGKTRGCSKAAVVSTRTVMRWPPVRCIPPLARASRRPVGNGNPAECGGAQTRSACAFVTKGGRRCTSARSRSAHNAHRDAHAHTRARVGGSLARMWPLSAVRGGRGRV